MLCGHPGRRTRALGSSVSTQIKLLHKHTHPQTRSFHHPHVSTSAVTVGTQAAVLAGLDITMFIEFSPPDNEAWVSRSMCGKMRMNQPSFRILSNRRFSGLTIFNTLTHFFTHSPTPTPTPTPTHERTLTNMCTNNYSCIPTLQSGCTGSPV